MSCEFGSESRISDIGVIEVIESRIAVTMFIERVDSHCFSVRRREGGERREADEDGRCKFSVAIDMG